LTKGHGPKSKVQSPKSKVQSPQVHRSTVHGSRSTVDAEGGWSKLVAVSRGLARFGAVTRGRARNKHQRPTSKHQESLKEEKYFKVRIASDRFGWFLATSGPKAKVQSPQKIFRTQDWSGLVRIGQAGKCNLAQRSGKGWREQTPNTKLQTPGKHQAPNSKKTQRR
jgi:hypothetical protein